MLKKANKIVSIVSLALYALFTCCAGYVYYNQARYVGSHIVMESDGGFRAEYQFDSKAIVFIIAAAILLAALISHVLKLIKSKKLAFPIICAALSIISLVLFFSLNTDLAWVMFFRYVLHIPFNITTHQFRNTFKLVMVTVILIAEIADLILSVLIHCNTKNDTEQIEV